jgi:hypothetical protein
MEERILTTTQVAAMAAAKAQERQARLVETRRAALAEGKEPFDYERVAEALDEGSWRFERVDHEARERELEEKYFVDFPEARTLAEFIRLYEQTEYG